MLPWWLAMIDTADLKCRVDILAWIGRDTTLHKAATTRGGQVSDTTTNTQAVTFHAVSDPWHIATAGGYLWATDSTAGGILKLDPLTGELTRKVTWGVAPIAIAADP